MGTGTGPDETKAPALCGLCKERPAWMHGPVPVCHHCVPVLLELGRDLEWDSVRARFADADLRKNIDADLARVPPRIVATGAYTRGWRDCRDWMAGKLKPPPLAY